MRNEFRIATLTLGLALAATPAFAQSDNKGANSDTVTIGVGAAIVPRYEGSDDSRIIPAGAIRGSVSGISFTTIGTALYIDVIPRREPTGGKFVLGPVVHVGFDRTSRKTIRDPQIVALGKIDTSIELGGQIGYSQNGVITSDYDNLSITVAGVHDVAGAHDSYRITPAISYGTPLSTKIYVGVSASADYVGDKFARTYFGVTPAQSLASGLPVFTPDSGFKDIAFSALGALSLSGDLRHGLSLFALGNYERLLGDFKRSPIVRDANQWIGAVGVAYTF